MDFGVTAAAIEDVGYLSFAENLGYDFAWAPDSQLLMSNPFPLMALAAQQTRRIRLGTGLAIAGLRLAPVLANAIATINRLAPGRVFLGVGTGNTAMRTMGQRPMAIKPFGEYVRVVRSLLAGEEIEYTHGGVTHLVRFQNRQLGHGDSPIPIHLGGLGPRAQTLAGELGDGLVTSLPRGGALADIRARLERGAASAGRSLDGFETVTLLNLLLLQPGESLSDDHVVAQCGSAIMANVHYLVDLHRETGAEPPAYVLPIWEEYLEFHATRDAERAHQQLHQSHYVYLDRDEARFITPEIIRNFCLAGQPAEIVEQLRAMEAQGVTGVNFIFPNAERYRMTEDFARKVIATY
ncbi:MAG: LLM class flavin-dependent oxidoreductase [Acidimicrobiia bacterium]|nr:LLM class flavin-dependent oxidoreductase [Acidimicrobiia bacterium]